MAFRPKKASTVGSCVLCALAVANGANALAHALCVFLKMREGFLPLLFYMLERSTVLLPLSVLLCGVTAVLFWMAGKSSGSVFLLVGVLAGVLEWCVFEYRFHSGQA